MSRRGGARVRAATKIAFDRVGSAVALLWLWPILAGIAVGIRLTMGSPVLFRQVRAGAACRHHRRSRHITPQPGTFAGEVYLLNTFGHIRHQMLKHAFLIVCRGVDTTSSAPANRCVKAIPPRAQHRASGCRHGLRRHTRGPSPASPRIQKVARQNPVVSGEENTRAEFSVNRVGEAAPLPRTTKAHRRVRGAPLRRPRVRCDARRYRGTRVSGREEAFHAPWFSAADTSHHPSRLS